MTASFYCEVSLTRNGILVGGRAYTSRRTAISAIRKFVSEPPVGWDTGRLFQRVGFGRWLCPDGRTVLSVDRFNLDGYLVGSQE